MSIRTIVPTFALLAGLAAGSALAQFEQEGLVNVSVDGTAVQVPIAVAANVCGVNVGVIAEMEQGEVVCEIDQQQAAEHGIQINGDDDTDDETDDDEEEHHEE